MRACKGEAVKKDNRKKVKANGRRRKKKKKKTLPHAGTLKGMMSVKWVCLELFC